MGRRGVLDLRQYTLRPGRRDVLIGLFDRYFVDGQEAAGMHIVGQFRDLDDPDRFVWLRGFDDMPARLQALQNFYYGPIWQEHRDAANATMLDSDNALLLRPIYCGPAYPVLGDPRPGIDTHDVPATTVLAIDVYHLAAAADPDALGELFLNSALPALDDAGAENIAVLLSDPSENNFPALPLRTESVLVWISRFADDDAHRRHQEQLADSAAWSAVSALLAEACDGRPTQQLRLRPTQRSQLH